MKLLTGKTLPVPCVLAVGKFESIHRGHRALIETVVSQAKKHGLASAVAAFSPHPYRVLGQIGYAPLFTRDERSFLLGGLGLDYYLEFPFDTALVQTAALDFGRVLFEDLRAAVVVVGEGFRFGRNREGTAKTLQALAKEYKRTVNVIKNYTSADTAEIGTSAIRALLEGGADENVPQLEAAAELLGFPFFAMGTVAQGQQLGRELGFPTMNLYPPTDKFLPRHGVYITQTEINGAVYRGITNIGLRPTVRTHETAPAIETHLFNFDGDVYGKDIRVDFLHFLRAERKFPNINALRAQIEGDVETAKQG